MSDRFRIFPASEHNRMPDPKVWLCKDSRAHSKYSNNLEPVWGNKPSNCTRISPSSKRKTLSESSGDQPGKMHAAGMLEDVWKAFPQREIYLDKNRTKTAESYIWFGVSLCFWAAHLLLQLPMVFSILWWSDSHPYHRCPQVYVRAHSCSGFLLPFSSLTARIISFLFDGHNQD